MWLGSGFTAEKSLLWCGQRQQIQNNKYFHPFFTVQEKDQYCRVVAFRTALFNRLRETVCELHSIQLSNAGKRNHNNHRDFLGPSYILA